MGNLNPFGFLLLKDPLSEQVYLYPNWASLLAPKLQGRVLPGMEGAAACPLL
jgi:hypothetical protein